MARPKSIFKTAPQATATAATDPDVDSILQETRRRASFAKPKPNRVRVVIRRPVESLHDQWGTAKPATAHRLPDLNNPPPNPLDDGK